MSKMTKLSDELAWRGFVNQTTYKDVSVLDGEPVTFYFGVDPSADSMTIGNLAAAMMVRHFVNFGHNPILLVGGATGMIGDPDGKAQERDLLTLEQLELNKAGISAQYKKLFAGSEFTMVDNYDWFKDFNYLDFLRTVGKHVPMRQMLGREFVQSRLGEEGSGISYAEFSYSLIQGYDFLHLYETYGATLQLCGADQWGNSITGVDLIRRIKGAEAHVWSAPLVINKSTGVKFGKSEEGAIWLDPKKTSPNDFYQFWINLDDSGIEYYFGIYTLLEKSEIQKIVAEHIQEPSKRLAQKKLAYTVTSFVHGEQEANLCESYVGLLNGELSLVDMSEEHRSRLEQNSAYINITSASNLLDVLVDSGLVSSKGEARRLIASGAISLQGEKVTDENINTEKFVSNNNLGAALATLKRGKKQKDTVVLAVNLS